MVLKKNSYYVIEKFIIVKLIKYYPNIIEFLIKLKK